MEEIVKEQEGICSEAQKESDVIKVPLCTFANDVKTVSTFYFCSCSKEDFFPICEACAKTCHKDHNPSLNIQGIYICKCGEKNHEITAENEQTFIQRKQNSFGKCFYVKFMELTPNNGYYAHGNKTYCAVCAMYCRKQKNEKEVDLLGLQEEKNSDDSELLEDTPLEKVEGINRCVCPKHFEHNVVNLNLDFASKPKFHIQLQNFNFNILSKIGVTEEKYLNYIIDKIKEYAIASDNANSPEIAAEESKDFFSEFIIYKILECFSMFATRWENKFFHVKDYFKGIPPEKLISLLRLRENASEINGAIIGDFFSAKFYFAELIYNYLVRTYFLKYNNLWNIRTIINMNLYQRKLYYHEMKNFFKFHSKETNAYREDVFNYMINSLLELYDNILIINDTGEAGENLQSILFSYIFPTFTRIFKYLFKGNLLNQEQTKKYYDLVFDSLKLWSEKIKSDENGEDKESQQDNSAEEEEEEEQESGTEAGSKDDEDVDIKKKIVEYEEDKEKASKSAYYVMKSILYTLIYTNDEVCLNYLKEEIDKSNNKFIFEKSQIIEKVCKVFMIIINSYLRKEDLSRTVIYDFYVRKILELLVSDGGFYLASIENCHFIDEYEQALLISSDFYLDAKQHIHTPYLEKLNSFNLKLGIYNRQYFDYGISYQSYIEKTNELMGELKTFITKDIGYMPNLKLNYAYFADLPNSKKFKKVQILQNVIKYTIFFQKMEEYIHIYSEGKTFTFKGDEPLIKMDMNFQRELLAFILKVYYLLMQNNNEIFTLVMNIKPKIFVGTFIDTGDNIFDFFDRMCEMLFTPNYTYDNFYFFSECLCFILAYVEDYFMKKERSFEQDLIKLGYIGRVLKLATRCIGKISIQQPDFLNIIDSIQNLADMVNTEKNMETISELLMSFFSDQDANQSILNVLVNYFNYMSELISNDFNFFSSTSHSKNYLFDVERVLGKINEIIGRKILPLELEYAIVNYYFKIKIGFNFTTERIQDQMIRIFKPISNPLQPIQDSELLVSNASLVNLAITSETPTPEDMKKKIEENIEQLEELGNLVNTLSLSFQSKFDQLFAKPKGYESYFELKIFFYHYFENILVRPVYRLINLFILQGDIINEKDKTFYAELMINFLNNILYFYGKLTSGEQSNLFDKNLEPHFKSCESKTEIFEFEDISLNKELTASEISDIEDNLKVLKEPLNQKNIEIIYQLLIKSIEKIFYMKPTMIESIKTTSVKSKKQPIVPYHIQRLDKLINKFIKHRTRTYDTALSLFSAVEVSKKEMDQEIGKELLLYLLYKLSDTLTDENYPRQLNTYQKGTINAISIDSFILQNSYVLVYLNSLFYNYSENFQAYLSECLGECFPRFFEFLTTDIVYSCSINEITKIYSLDTIRDFNQQTGEKKSTLCGEICGLAIKMTQNMCESHNRIFQNRFFNFKFDINGLKYFDCMEEEKENNIKGIPEKLIESDSEEEKKPSVPTEEEKKPAEDEKKKFFLFKNFSKSETMDEKKRNNLKASNELAKKVKSEVDIDKKIELENKEYLENSKYSFLNFIIHNMRLIINNLQIGNTKQNLLLRNIQAIKSVDDILDLYQHFSDLVIEMIQGTKEENFDNIYIRLSEKYQLFNELGEINYSTLSSFIFLQHCIEMEKILSEKDNIFDKEILPIILNMFTIIVNIISQEVKDTAIIQNLIIIFPPEKVIGIIGNYLKGLVINHIKHIEYDDPGFEEEFQNFEFGNRNYAILKKFFKEHSEMYDDEFFKLAGQMYLFLTILGKKYHIPEAEKVIRYEEKEIAENEKEGEEGGGGSDLPEEEDPKSLIANHLRNAASAAKDMVDKNTKMLALPLGGQPAKKKPAQGGKTKVKHEMNTYIIASRFFNKIIKTCEFMVENDGEMNLKIIYYIIDPRAYLISKNNMETFFDEVDRSSSTTKLKSFIDSLNTYLYEINFKYDSIKRAPYLKWMFGIYYKNIDFFNFCCSLAINIMLILFLDKNPITATFVRVLTISMAGFQIFVNLIILTIFLISKYNFYVLLSKTHYKHITWLDYPSIYLLNPFLLNGEVYLIIYVVVLGVLGVFSRNLSFLFPLQLISVVKFVAIIKDIVKAFQMTIDQVFSTIGFLMLFLFFYSNLGYNFFRSEFEIEYDEGLVGNVCSTLLECSITYFNQGVRSGGGIGDLLAEKEFKTAMYWVRWVNDFLFFIVVISLLMNMSSGIILSTFSKIKEESTAKEEDINNKCFICNIDRGIFDKLKIQFSEHQKSEHNVKNYIRFLMYLKFMNEKDLDADQSFIINCINNRDIRCFPVGRSFSTGVCEEDDEEDDNDDEEEEEEDDA